MIEKVVHKYKRNDPEGRRADLDYWLSRPSEERIAAVDFLRQQMYGDLPCLQRIARVVPRSRC